MDCVCSYLKISRPHSEESESSESEDEEIQGRDEKLNESTLHDDSSEDVNDFATIRTSSPCPEKEKDESCNMDVDSNDGEYPVYFYIARSFRPDTSCKLYRLYKFVIKLHQAILSSSCIIKSTKISLDET